MKKISVLLLTLILAVTLSACTNTPTANGDNGGNTENATTQSTTANGKPSQSTTSTTQKTAISKDEAIAIALNHAGLKQTEIVQLEVELDPERGVYEWEVEFDKDNYEYSYDIDATTGKILWSEKDIDD